MSKAAADTLGWSFRLLGRQGMMAVAVAVQQGLGGGCPNNLETGQKYVSVIFFICYCISTKQVLILSSIMHLNFVQIVFWQPLTFIFIKIQVLPYHK